jgi:hypothetical protein
MNAIKPSELELAVIASFFPRPKGCILKTIQCKCTYSAEFVYDTLQKLEKRGVVSKIWLGQTLAYDLNTETYDAYAGYILYVRLHKSEIRARAKKVAVALNDIAKKVAVDSIVLQNFTESDVNVVCILKTIEKNIEDIITTIITSIGKRFNLNIKPSFYSYAKFLEFKNQMYDFFAQFGDFAIPWSGFETYYTLVYKSNKPE